MENVHDVPAAFIERLGPMDAMKLQKLVYYAQAWSLTDGAPLFSDPIEAWKDGPVVRRLFNVHRGRYTVTEWTRGDAGQLTSRGRGVIDHVAATYGAFTGRALSLFTHLEGPWNEARADLPEDGWSDAEIDPSTIARYYRQLVASPEEAVTHAVDSARLESADLPVEFTAVLSSVAAGERAANSVIDDILGRPSPR